MPACCAQLLRCVWLFATPWTVAHQVSLSVGLSHQEYWSGLLFTPPADLPTQVSNLHWQVDSLPLSHLGSSSGCLCSCPCSVVQFCLTPWDPMDSSLPGSSVHRIFQARILEWAAIPYSRESSQPTDQTQVSRITGRLFTVWATMEVLQNTDGNKTHLLGARKQWVNICKMLGAESDMKEATSVFFLFEIF